MYIYVHINVNVYIYKHTYLHLTVSSLAWRTPWRDGVAECIPLCTIQALLFSWFLNTAVAWHRATKRCLVADPPHVEWDIRLQGQPHVHMDGLQKRHEASCKLFRNRFVVHLGGGVWMTAHQFASHGLFPAPTCLGVYQTSQHATWMPRSIFKMTRWAGGTNPSTSERTRALPHRIVQSK